MLLGLNPGFSHDDAATHADPRFIRLSRASMAHASSDYPFYLLNPAAIGPGRRWWDQRLGRLIDVAGREAVAGRVLCISLRSVQNASITLRNCPAGFEPIVGALRDPVSAVSD